jgi:hypothetical protein
VFKREATQVRLFWASEMTNEMADPGQDPRDAPDIASLWSILDLTPGGRGTRLVPEAAVLTRARRVLSRPSPRPPRARTDRCDASHGADDAGGRAGR